MRRGLSPTGESARAAIDAGLVTVGGAPATKPTRLVAPDEAVVVSGDGPRFVSRGGDKLDAALDRFGVTATGRRALDAGASTGGFTDCLLQRGATEVVAVDVGYGLLADRIRHDPRVRLFERTNVRHLRPDRIGGACSLVVADLSFISLGTVVSALLACCSDDGELVLLVKPQFEATRAETSRGRGIIRDPTVWARVLGEAETAIAERGAAMMGAMVSPLTGADGNVEFLVHARPAGASVQAVGDRDLAAVVAAVVAEAAAGRPPTSGGDG